MFVYVFLAPVSARCPTCGPCSCPVHIRVFCILVRSQTGKTTCMRKMCTNAMLSSKQLARQKPRKRRRRSKALSMVQSSLTDARRVGVGCGWVRFSLVRNSLYRKQLTFLVGPSGRKQGTRGGMMYMTKAGKFREKRSRSLAAKEEERR